uniref:Dynein heavy chain n=1 Tax=Palpitomonas bilix TaxID=652834 RepID=A0A7S3G9X5_9EUKA
MEEYGFFLRGGQVLSKESQPPNPAADWLSEVSWDNITELDKLSNFRGISSALEQNLGEWREWYTVPEPETAPLPGEWENKCNELQRLIIVRSLRSDRVVSAVRSFIISNLGQQFVEPPAFDLGEAFGDSSNSIPLIFVLSPGVDPKSQLELFAKDRGMDGNLKSIALGQGQAPIATRMIEDGIKYGHWVFLANCHLSISWMPQLEKIIEKIPLDKPNEKFRLWLSSSPHPKFPISVLQSGVKMTTEPPKGLKANLLRLYSSLSDERISKCTKPNRYKKLLFSLCYFHAVLIERRKFLTLGWNIPYDFNLSDFDICENILTLYLDSYEETPWDALRYLIGEANYGGRVTDDRDRDLLRTYMKTYFCPDVINTANFPLSKLPNYFVPDDGNLDHYKSFVVGLPSTDHPEAFGQHPNADIASQIQETSAMLDTLLSLQPQAVAGEGESKDDKVSRLASDILEHVPPVFDVEEAYNMKSDDMSPLNVVLIQEIERYNILLKMMKSGLENLLKGIKGVVVMSSELEETYNALFDARVPQAWQKVYPSMKPLAPWTRDLLQRTQQLANWVEGTYPKVYWLSGFTFPTGFLTALLQTSARKNNLPIDAFSWEFVVVNQEEKDITNYPREGAYIKGMYLEGGAWDYEHGCLVEPQHMELVVPMPIIHFKPVDSKKKSAKGSFYKCPCYYYPVRTGTRERPSYIISVDLKAGSENDEFWIKRGTALLLSLQI